MLYGTECWTAKREHEHKLSVAEMKMLRWMSGHTLLDKIRNEDIRERVGVVPIVEKMVESRLRYINRTATSNYMGLEIHGLEIDGGNQDMAAAHQHIDCGGKCGYRCSKAGRPKICMRACKTCCQRCNCVPPGTAGNQNACPCYASLTTHGGKLKCP
ncbi:Gibberellin-regulated protein [Arachis hypogaea]|nr:Gibberellin-regulated protein [Arachis hypogaea]